MKQILSVLLLSLQHVAGAAYCCLIFRIAYDNRHFNLSITLTVPTQENLVPASQFQLPESRLSEGLKHQHIYPSSLNINGERISSSYDHWTTFVHSVEITEQTGRLIKGAPLLSDLFILHPTYIRGSPKESILRPFQLPHYPQKLLSFSRTSQAQTLFFL